MSDLPEPMTPADCDLSDFAFMPLDVQRLFTSDTWILGSAEEKVAALTLWGRAWHQVPAGSLPDNDRILAHLSGAGTVWKRVAAHALRGWVKCSDGRLYHPVVAGKANDAWKKKLFHRERSKKANDARWGKSSGGPLSGGGSNGQSEPGDHHGDDRSEPSQIPSGSLLRGVQEASFKECLKECLDDPKGEGEGKRERQGEKKEPKAAPLGAVAPHPPPRDPAKEFFDQAIPLVISLTGMSRSGAGGFVVKLVQRAKDNREHVLEALRAADEQRPLHPQPWLVKAVEARAAPPHKLDWMVKRAAELQIELGEIVH